MGDGCGFPKGTHGCGGKGRGQKRMYYLCCQIHISAMVSEGTTAGWGERVVRTVSDGPVCSVSEEHGYEGD